jgi:hypothetical protein
MQIGPEKVPTSQNWSKLTPYIVSAKESKTDMVRGSMYLNSVKTFLRLMAKT